MTQEFLASRRNQHLLGLGLLLVLVAICYADTLRYGFVYDDHMQIIDKQHYFTQWSWLPEYFKHPMTLNYYRPIFLVWFLLNRMAFDLHPAGWHATTVFAHFVATGLCYLTAYLLTRRVSFALIVGAVFAVHPAHVESVAWISGVSDPLLAMFVFGSFCCYLVGRESAKRIPWWTASALLAFGAMLSKEVGIVVPALIGIHALLFSTHPRTTRLREAIAAAAPSSALALLYLYLRHRIMLPIEHNLSTTQAMVFSWPKAYLFYLWHLVWPVRMSIFYDFYLEQRPSFSAVILPACLLFAAFGVCLYLWWKDRAPLIVFALAWIVITILPVLYFKAYNPNDLVHDRYLYLPVFGLGLILTALFETFPSRGRQLLRTSAATVVATVVLVTAYLFVSITEEAHFESDLKLYYRAIQISPRNVFAWMNAGVQFAEAKRPAEAEAAYRHALELPSQSNTMDWLIHDNLGFLLVETGRLDAGEKELNISLQGNPTFPKTYMHVAILRMRQERWPDALAALQKAIAYDPWTAEYHYMKAFVHNKLGDPASEKAELEKTVQLDATHERARERLRTEFPVPNAQ